MLFLTPLINSCFRGVKNYYSAVIKYIIQFCYVDQYRRNNNHKNIKLLFCPRCKYVQIKKIKLNKNCPNIKILNKKIEYLDETFLHEWKSSRTYIMQLIINDMFTLQIQFSYVIVNLAEYCKNDLEKNCVLQQCLACPNGLFLEWKMFFYCSPLC